MIQAPELGGHYEQSLLAEPSGERGASDIKDFRQQSLRGVSIPACFLPYPPMGDIELK